MPNAERRQRTYGQWWDTTEEMVTVPLGAVRRIGMAGLQAGGATEDDAAFILEAALDKALQGDHSRGLGRLPGTVRAAMRGSVDLHPQVRVLRERGATALVGAGPKAIPSLVCRFAMGLAIDKARQHGVGWVAAQAQGGSLTPFVKQAVAQDMVGLALTQSFPSVAPLGGMTPFLGNAPVAVGVPAAGRDPVVLDLSITESSASGVAQAARQGQRVPEGLILDERGEPTTDAREFVKPEWLERGAIVPRGSLRPLGGGHKGYALVFIVGLLAYVMTDSPPWENAQDLSPAGHGGTVLISVDPSAFAPLPQVREQVDLFIQRVKGAPRRTGVSEILYPGERSQQLQREGKASGRIAIPASHYQGLVGLARELGMEGAI